MGDKITVYTAIAIVILLTIILVSCAPLTNGESKGALAGQALGTLCGNLRIDLGEECDDGNAVNTDLCTSACKWAKCGDGFPQKPNRYRLVEECDDGNINNTDYCTTKCLWAKCGDGFVQKPNSYRLVEQCDDGNTIDTDACSNKCVSIAAASSCTNDFSGQIAGKELWFLDFEELNDQGWVSGWTKPKQQVAGTKLSLFELDATVKHSGLRSLKISAPDVTYSGSITLITGALGVPPGTEYTVSFWVKGQGVVSNAGHTAILHKTAKQLPNGGLEATNSVYQFTNYPTSTYNWQHIVKTFTIPSNQDALLVTILFQDGSGTVWLDDIEVMPSQIYNSLPATSLKLQTKTPEAGAVSHHYFLRDQPIQASAIVHNHNAVSDSYDLKVSLTSCGSLIQQAAKSIQVNADERITVPLLTINPSTLEVGDYMLNATLEKNGQILDRVLYPIGLRLDPQPEFLLSIGTSRDITAANAAVRMDRLKANNITPLIYGGEPQSYIADAALSRNMPFTVRLMPTLNLPVRKGAKGEDFTGLYAKGLSNTDAWADAAQQIKYSLQWTNHFPAFFPRIFTSDDFQLYSGWDWADMNKQRFNQLTGLDAPVPAEFANSAPNYDSIQKISMPKGVIPADEPWLLWNKFLSKDVLGGYNKQVTSAVTQVDLSAKIGPIPGGEQLPLFWSSMSHYPPYNFGENGFNMISYYLYLNYWRPELAYMYWTDIARMGNRDIPVYVMPDALMPEESYTWNNFYLMLASDVQGIAYFIDPESTPEFWNAVKNKIGPIAAKFGPLFAQLSPEQRKVGLVSSFTTANYRFDQPLHDLCAYTNLMMAHVDVEPVSEEELLAGRGSQYNALIFSDVDWMRKDVVDILSGLSAPASTTPIILDKDTEVSFIGDNVHKINFNLVNVGCTGASYAGDYDKIEHLNEISSAIEAVVPPDVLVSNETVIFRKYSAGNAKYLWLVNVHSYDEYLKLFNWMTYQGGYSNQAALTEIKNYLQGRGVYTSKMQSTVSLPNLGNAVIVDVMDGKVLGSSVNDGWTTFKVDIDRLAGKLIAVYPALPSRVAIEVPQNVIAGQKYVIKTTVTDGTNAIASSFPLSIELIDPSGKKHAYSQFSATNGQGTYELPITLGTNAVKGVWVLRVTELSTKIMSSVRFTVQ